MFMVVRMTFTFHWQDRLHRQYEDARLNLDVYISHVYPVGTKVIVRAAKGDVKGTVIHQVNGCPACYVCVALDSAPQSQYPWVPLTHLSLDERRIDFGHVAQQAEHALDKREVAGAKPCES